MKVINNRLTYKFPITKLEPNQIFVFGSNTEGRHGKGAALWAKNNAHAVYGQAFGLQGQSYAIVTKNLNKFSQPSVTKGFIKDQITDLYTEASNNFYLNYMIAYRDSDNLNGYTSEEMANMFNRDHIPANIIFEESFLKLMI